MRLVLSFMVSALLIGCAISASVYRSGIKFEGANAPQSELRYWTEIDKDSPLIIGATCSAYEELSGMFSLIVPLPPLIPLASKESVSTINKPFGVHIGAREGKEIDTDIVKISIIINDKIYYAKFLETRKSEYEPGFTGYYFSTQLTCGQIRSATLKVENFDGEDIEFKIRYYDGTNWEAGYLAA